MVRTIRIDNAGAKLLNKKKKIDRYGLMKPKKTAFYLATTSIFTELSIFDFVLVIILGLNWGREIRNLKVGSLQGGQLFQRTLLKVRPWQLWSNRALCFGNTFKVFELLLKISVIFSSRDGLGLLRLDIRVGSLGATLEKRSRLSERHHLSNAFLLHSITWYIEKLCKICTLFVAARPSFICIVKKWSPRMMDAVDGVWRIGLWEKPFTTSSIVAGNIHFESKEIFK
jgi:hypothetical protein